MRTLFGVWLSGSILLNAFWVWIGRIWNGSNPAWALGFPIAVLAVVSCVMVGAVKQRGALITIGLIAYGVLWTLLVIDKWRISITPPPRYSLGHPFGDNPLRGANEEEGRYPAGRGSGGRP